MSLSLCGLDSRLNTTPVTLIVSKDHLFIQLANAIDWKQLYDIVAEDLKSTTKKGFWNLGRRLLVRIHLAVFILQSLLKATDREMEARIKDTPVLQVFCGKSILSFWKCPDHTKIEEFRNRLSPGNPTESRGTYYQGSASSWDGRSFLDGHRLHCSASKYNLSVRRNFDEKTFRENLQGNRILKEEKKEIPTRRAYFQKSRKFEKSQKSISF